MSVLSASVVFPLQGPLANLCIGLESIIIFLCIAMMGVFLWDYVSSSKTRRNARNFVWSLIFFGLGGAYLIYLFTDYVITDPAIRFEYSTYAYALLTTGPQIAIILSEQIEKTKTRIFSIIGVVNIILIITVVVTQIGWLVTIIYIIGIPAGVGFIVYYSQRLYVLADRSPQIRNKILAFFVSVMVIMLGYFCIGDFLMLRLGLGIRVVGDLLVILGIHRFKSALDYLPDFSEFEWTRSLRGIIVVHTNGIPLMSRFWNAKKEVDEMNKNDKDTLISGAISTVEIMLNEMVGKEKLNRIQLQDKVVLFEKRKSFMTMVIATDYFESLAIRTQNFTDRFEEMFGSMLPDWSGNTSLFLPAEALTDIHFIPR